MSCDGIAPHYQQLEYLCFGKSLEQQRFAFLDQTRASRRALVCGGGDGRFLARLLHSNPVVEVDFVDLSQRMAAIAERRVMGMGARFSRRVRFHVGDIRTFEAVRQRYDLITTHFFLDCFSDREIDSIVSRLAAAARPGAQWIISDFRVAQEALGAIWTYAIVRGLYVAFRVTTGLRVSRLPEYKSSLLAHGFHCRMEQRGFAGLLYSSLWNSPMSSAA
jgi:ubiquinone/menaquinone biosynthesis C-methylase UbiE